MANTAASLSGFDTILNNNESSNLCQPTLVRIFIPAHPCLLDFLILLVLENMIYLAFGMFQLLFLLGTVMYGSAGAIIHKSV